MTDSIQIVTLVATSLSAVGAVAAAVATYYGVAAPALQRKRDARAVALASMDSYLPALVALRNAFAINTLLIAGLRREWDEMGDAEKVRLELMSRASVPEVPRLPADWHNLELSIALDRLRDALAQWENAASTFSLDARAFFIDEDKWADHAFEYLDDRRAHVMNSIRNVGRLVEPVLMHDRKEELAKVLIEHDGLDFFHRKKEG